MPLIKVESTQHISAEQKSELLESLSASVAEITGKSEKYVMALWADAEIILGGGQGAAAFVEVRGIGGLDDGTNKRLSASICDILDSAADIPPDRVYINFTDIPRSNWGWNSTTF
jgi:phenylpyruvate tautomerase PptA (4-oxalocrotonate tautomerase family)